MRLKVDLEVTDELIEQIKKEMRLDLSTDEVLEGLKGLEQELNDPDRLVLVLENLNYFNY